MTKGLLESGTSQSQYDEESLLKRIAKLEEELRVLKEALEAQRERNSGILRSHARLRQILDPLFSGLRAVYGELQEGNSTDPARPAQSSDKWEVWKRKLGGKQAEFIQALLEHGEMTGAQLKIATRSGQQTVYDTIHKINQAQLLKKDGGKYSLKEL